MKYPIPLGAAPDPGVPAACYAVSVDKLSEVERLAILEEQVGHMSRVIAALRKRVKKDHSAYEAAGEAEGLNKDSIPVGTVCTGATDKSPFFFYLTVLEDGYQVGSMIFESLSAAAERVSGVRRSGWTFWKLPGGRTLKEVYKGD